MIKSIAKTVTASLVVIGAVMGAGFSSGQEINAFFRGQNIVMVFVLSFAIFLAGFCLFLFSGKDTSGDLNVLHKQMRFSGVFGGLIVFSMFVIFCSMISGINAIFYALYPSRLFALAAQLLISAACAYLLSRGFGGVKKLSLIALPFALIIILVICLKNIPQEISGDAFWAAPFPASLMYCSMNIALSVGALNTLGAELSVKEIKAAAVISALVLSTLLCLLLCVLSPLPESVMPIFLLAKTPIAIASCFALLFISIVTTLLTAAHGVIESLDGGFRKIFLARRKGTLSKNSQKLSTALPQSMAALPQNARKSGLRGKTFLILCFFLIGNAVSLMGFDNIVNFIYPAISVFCVIYIAAVFLCRLKLMKTKKAVPSKKANARL